MKKDPRKKFELQDVVKNRLLIDPRGHYKTSLDICDCVQWMLNFPNVTILLLSGAKDLAARMVKELKEIFLMNGDFRELYPDFLPKETDFGAEGEFTLPNRTRIRREPTIMVTTLASKKASIHCDIRKGDDVVNEKNSQILAGQKTDPNKKVIDDWNATNPLLNPGGYTDLIGTFYNFSCLYADRLQKLGLMEHLRFGYPLIDIRKGWSVHVRPAIIQNGNGELFNADGIIFPDKFCIHANADPTKKDLQTEWEDDPDFFYTQYMSYPRSEKEDFFPLPKLKEQTIPIQKVPMNSVAYVVWDSAYEEGKQNDFTVGIVGAFDPVGNIYVVDMFRGRFSPFAYIEKIIEAWRKWPIQREGIEKAAGLPLLLPGLQARMRDLGLMIPIDWIDIKRKKDSTKKEILSLSTLIEQKKLWFVESLPDLNDLYIEFNRFGKYSHDDICRAVSLLLFYRDKAQFVQPNPALEQPEIIGAQAYGWPDDEERLSAGIVG